jgi:hypothetical protein
MNSTEIELALHPIDQDKFHARINEWTDALEADFNTRNPNSTTGIRFECGEPGNRYCRIVQCDGNGTARSVHAFYDLRNGDVYKAEGWKKPAKGVRFNLLDDASFALMLANLSWSGGYLYAKRGAK